MSQPKFFYYNDSLYLRIIPAKRLFNSTLVHEVVTRGDVFAVHMDTLQFTILPGTATILPLTQEQQDKIFLPPFIQPSVTLL